MASATPRLSTIAGGSVVLFCLVLFGGAEAVNECESSYCLGGVSVTRQLSVGPAVRSLFRHAQAPAVSVEACVGAGGVL